MRRALAAWTAVVALATGACGSTSDEDAPGDARLRFGQAVAEQPAARLQPDVVVVGGGGDAIRSVTADGLTWRIDARARHARDLAPGKVMFVTDRAVGRVLDLVEEGSDLLVTVGPVDLTEVVRDGTFDKAGITLGDPLIYLAGQPLWAQTGTPPGGAGKSVRLRRQDDRPAQPAPVRGGAATTKALGYTVYTSCCTDGVGAHFTYDDGGVRLAGTVTLTFRKPDASFHLAIGAGKVTRAEFAVSGGFGIKVDFEGGIQDGRNHRKQFPIDADLSFPIGQLAGIPLSFTVSQTLTVETAFGAKLGTIKGSGEFGLAGSIGFGYRDGSFGPRVTDQFQRKSSLLNSLTGIPVGVMGLVIRHGVRFTVGISALVFKAGVYAELTTSYGTTLGSALGAAYAQCRGVAIGVQAAFGIGYSILEPVVKVINKFLSLLTPITGKPIPPIPSGSGLRWPHTVYQNEEVIPDAEVCGRPPR
ncbi:hypothetical protein AB0M47_22895 [Hamadaea sp. NPDC051192]|uniref:hypothetical protein n=1 Tax=Hamadaea sp. NPDC051192 TaxID=3154940 RepID=UPI003424E857